MSKLGDMYWRQLQKGHSVNKPRAVLKKQPENQEVRYLLLHLRNAIELLQTLNPHVPDDCVDQLPVTLQHQYERDLATMRQMVHQLDSFGADLYKADKQEIDNH